MQSIPLLQQNKFDHASRLLWRTAQLSANDPQNQYNLDDASRLLWRASQLSANDPQNQYNLDDASRLLWRASQLSANHPQNRYKFDDASRAALACFATECHDPQMTTISVLPLSILKKAEGLANAFPSVWRFNPEGRERFRRR